MNCFPFDFLQARLRWLMACLLLVAAVPLVAQTCKEADEIDPATRSAIESTAKSFLSMSAGGDVADCGPRPYQVWRQVLAASSRLFSTTKTDCRALR